MGSVATSDPRSNTIGAFSDLGVATVILGLVATASPFIATLVVETFAGWLFLTGGFIGLAVLFTTADCARICVGGDQCAVLAI